MDRHRDNHADCGGAASPTMDRVALTGAMHEIREPLGLLLGAAELLGEDGLDPAAQAEMRRMIRRNGEIMSTRIAELFDLVAIEAGLFELHPGLHALDRVVETAAELARHEAGDRPVGVEIGLPGQLEPFVWVDPDRLRQVLYSMLAHGVRTTARGAVRLEITQRPLAHNRVELAFALHAGADAGSTPIVDGDGRGPGHWGGGLLHGVAARIARLLGGELVMECAERGGSVVRFTLALPAVEMDTDAELFADGESVPADREPSLRGVRILVVEDGAANQRLLAQLLRREGATVHIARDGAVAMGLATTAAGAGQAYRLILMDTGLPGADGLETTRSLRAAGVACPVVALVGGGGGYTREGLPRSGLCGLSDQAAVGGGPPCRGPSLGAGRRQRRGRVKNGGYPPSPARRPGCRFWPSPRDRLEAGPGRAEGKSMSERARSSSRWRCGLAELPWGTVLLLTVAAVGSQFVAVTLLARVLPEGLRPWQAAALDALVLGAMLPLFIVPLLIVLLRSRLREYRAGLAKSVARTALVEGDDYHRAMIACLGEQLHASYAAVAAMDGAAIRTIAAWIPGGSDASGVDRLAGTPWDRVLGGGAVCDARGAAARRPSVALLAELGAESFIGVPIADAQGRMVGLVLVVGDRPLGDARSALTLTQLLAARAGAELRRAEALRGEAALRRRQDAIMRLIDDTTIVSITDRSGRITHVNDNFCQIAGYSREELVGQDHRLVNSGYHPRTLWTDLYRAASAGEVWAATVRNRRRDGSYYWLKAGVIGMLDERGALEEIVSVRSDVTEIIEADQRSRVLVAAMESSPAAICVLDAGARITIANRAFRELFDLSPAATSCGTLCALMPNQEVREEIQAVMAEGQRLALRIRMAPRSSGPRDINLLGGGERGGLDSRWFDVELDPIGDDGSVAGCFICVLRDVDDQVREERRLRLEAEGHRVQMEIAAVLDDEYSELHDRLTMCVRSLASLEGLDLLSEGGLFLAEDDGLRLCARDAGCGQDPRRGERGGAGGECLCARVLQAAEAGQFEVLVSDDCLCDPRREIRPQGVIAHGHYIVPLQWAGRCEGVMLLYTELHPTRESERLELLLRVGEQMGGAIVRDRLRAAASRDEQEAALAADFAALRGACVAVLNTGRIPFEARVREVLDYVCASGNLGFRGSASAFVIDDSGMRLLAAYGDEDLGDAMALPLVHRGEALGELAIGVETEGIGQTVRREFLIGLAELIAAALHSERHEQRTARARRDKRDILFTLGREMRTPMTSIVAAADLLREEGVAEPDRDELAEMIRRNADHLLSVVDNVLDLSGANSESSLRASGEGGSQVRELRGARILLLEHDEGAAEAVATALRGAGALVEVSRRAEIGVAMALGAVRAGRPHALVIMTERAAITEVELAPRLLRENGYLSPIILLADPDAGMALLDAGADMVVPPGLRAAEEVLQAAAGLLGHHRDQRAA